MDSMPGMAGRVSQIAGSQCRSSEFFQKAGRAFYLENGLLISF